MDNFHSPPQCLAISLPGKGHTEALILLFLSHCNQQSQGCSDWEKDQPVILWNPFQNGKNFKVLPEIFSLRAPISNQFCLTSGEIISYLLIANVNTLHVYYYLCYVIIYWFDLFISSFVIYCLQYQHCPVKIFYQHGIKFFLPPKCPCFESFQHFPLFPPNLSCCPTVFLQM